MMSNDFHYGTFHRMPRLECLTYFMIDRTWWTCSCPNHSLDLSPKDFPLLQVHDILRDFSLRIDSMKDFVVRVVITRDNTSSRIFDRGIQSLFHLYATTHVTSTLSTFYDFLHEQ
ncbi:hypothetical protein TNCT_630251 [Trichonephila clavata]|uniref:Uncharacterized protein n=1 Tax=Trichonephila clavata TaxID=2740835 RepID=A0A8X6J1Q2_TRICU|nr:hypothetical protein TNCT_630251 [Trichonephila clavata]